MINLAADIKIAETERGKKVALTENGGENLPKEAFAHMFCAIIQNPEALNYIEKYFPKSYEIFNEMIEEYVKGRVRNVN